ncbi:hypothetical protein ACFV1W_11155 [Kitasatospora sp. NPDC059648]|uniref:hypothetical protein n=1 Tax=Kitasatospora sp. NPDC059648 TaxID=3346894 RepID=UPI0036769F57
MDGDPTVDDLEVTTAGYGAPSGRTGPASVTTKDEARADEPDLVLQAPRQY